MTIIAPLRSKLGESCSAAQKVACERDRRPRSAGLRERFIIRPINKRGSPTDGPPSLKPQQNEYLHRSADPRQKCQDPLNWSGDIKPK